MAKLQTPFPTVVQHLGSVDVETRAVLQSLIRQIETFKRRIIKVVNFNAITFVSQAARPTPANGAMQVWEDSDATTGNPTHYIVYTDDNGTTVTFASEEIV